MPALADWPGIHREFDFPADEVDEAKDLIREFLDDPERLLAASHKGGRKSTRLEIETRRSSLLEIIEPMQPMTVRQAFYQATVQGIVEKEESGYDKVQRALALMRREDELPWEYIVDNTRDRDRPYTSDSIADALQETIDQYRKALWNNINAHVEIWLEKDALAGVLSPVTRKYDVSLMVARGYSSLTFLHDAAENINNLEKPCHIYYLCDFDPSGDNACDECEEFLSEYASDADIDFTRLAVKPEQIEQWSLTTRPTKLSDSRAGSFFEKYGARAQSCELDAIDPRRLRDMVERSIQRHMSKKKYGELMEREKREKEKLRELIEQISDEAEEDEDPDSQD
jgi:hypothetical protein